MGFSTPVRVSALCKVLDAHSLHHLRLRLTLLFHQPQNWSHTWRHIFGPKPEIWRPFLCGSDHCIGAMPRMWGLRVLCFISASPAKRCFLPSFRSVLFVGISCASDSLSATDFVLLHSFYKPEFLVFTHFTSLPQLITSPFLQARIRSTPRICDTWIKLHSFERQ